MLPLVDLVLYDLKIFDGGRHRASTGVDNGIILENARRIAATGKLMWIRTPIIPGHTADEDNVAALENLTFSEEELAAIEAILA